MKLFAAVATLAAKDVACSTTAVHAHQDGFFGCPAALDDGDVLQSVRLLAEGYDAEVSVLGGEVCLLTAFYQRFQLQSVGNEVLDGNDAHAMLGSHFAQLRHACHGAVRIQYLDEGCCGVHTGQAGQVDGRLRVSCTTQYTLVLCVEGVDVSWLAKG